MTVAEFIEKLKQLPQEAVVMVVDEEPYLSYEEAGEPRFIEPVSWEPGHPHGMVLVEQ